MSKEMMYEKYCSLRRDFLDIAESFVDSNVLYLLKRDYAHNIGSKRKLSKAKDLKTLMRLLEKRDIVSYDNIDELFHISKTYIDKSELKCKLSEYKNWLQTVPLLPAYNMYQSDYTLASLRQQENTAENNNNNNIQESYHSEQEERESDKRQSLQQAAILQISERLGRSWRDVARHLGIRECEIDTAEKKYSCDFKKQSHEILRIYTSQVDREQWVINLIRALEKARRKDLKEFVEELILRDKNI